MAISLQLRDLRGNYGVNVALNGKMPHTPRNSHIDHVIAIYRKTSSRGAYGRGPF